MARFTSSLSEAILDTAWKLGIRTVKMNPKGTTSSREHEYFMRKHGLDKHMASTYIISLRGLETITQ